MSEYHFSDDRCEGKGRRWARLGAAFGGEKGGVVGCASLRVRLLPPAIAPTASTVRAPSAGRGRWVAQVGRRSAVDASAGLALLLALGSPATSHARPQVADTVTVSAPGPATETSPDETARRKQAAQLFEQGLSAFQSGEFETARQRYAESMIWLRILTLCTTWR